MTRPDDLPGYVNELVRPFTTTERYEIRDGKRRVRKKHTVVHRPLLEQLDHSTTSSGGRGAESLRPVPGSRPAGRLDVLALLDRIDRALDGWGVLTREESRSLRVSALAGREGDPEVEQTVRGWWGAARILTSYDSPAFTPNVPCPDCDTLGSLRVRVEEEEHERLATCTACHAVWDGAYFGPLAMWVRWCYEHLSDPKHGTCEECAVEKERLAERRSERRIYAAVPA